MVAAWIRFLRAHAAITRELSARLEAEHGLTLSDYDVLVQLYYAPERRMRRVDIARTVLLTASGITRLLDGLERAGLGREAALRRGRTGDLRRAHRRRHGDVRGGARRSHLADIEELFGSSFDAARAATLAELLGRLPLADTSPACTGEEEA